MDVAPAAPRSPGQHGPHQLKVVLGHSGIPFVQDIPAVHPVPEIPAACPVPDDGQPVADARGQAGKVMQREPPGGRVRERAGSTW